MVKSPCLVHGLREQGGGGGTPRGSMRGGPVTKIVDRRQAAVRAAAAGYRASLGESAPSCGATLAAVPEGFSQRPVTGRRRLSRGLAPNTVFVLEQSFLLHHTAAAALIHASPAAATDGTGVALDGGVGETPRGRVEGAGHIELPPRSRPAPVLRFIASVPAQTTARPRTAACTMRQCPVARMVDSAAVSIAMYPRNPLTGSARLISATCVTYGSVRQDGHADADHREDDVEGQRDGHLRARGEEIDQRPSGCEPIVDCPYVAGSLKARTRQSRTETPSGQSGSFSAGG
jgi:hypothetical protein